MPKNQITKKDLEYDERGECPTCGNEILINPFTRWLCEVPESNSIPCKECGNKFKLEQIKNRKPLKVI